MFRTTSIVACSAAVLGVLVGWGVGEVSATDPAAIICSIAGQARLQEKEGARWRQAILFDWLSAGATVEADKGSRLVIAFASGARCEIGEGSRATVGPADITSSTGTIRKLAPAPVMASIFPILLESKNTTRPGGVRLRGGATQRPLRGLYPASGDAVLADHALLSFEPMEGRHRYRIEIEDEAGSNMLSAEVFRTELLVPAGILRPAAIYYLRVRTLEAGGASSVYAEADFVTVDEGAERLRNDLARSAQAAGDPDALLVLVRLEAQLGLRREACRTLAEARSRFPANPSLDMLGRMIVCDGIVPFDSGE